jgi:hypothetical protein
MIFYHSIFHVDFTYRGYTLKIVTWHQWFTFVIPSTLEAEIKRFTRKLAQLPTLVLESIERRIQVKCENVVKVIENL